MTAIPPICEQGHAVFDTSKPCPICQSTKFRLALSGRSQGMARGGASLAGHKMIHTQERSWPFLLALLAIILLSGFPAYYLSGWLSVVLSWTFSAVSSVVGYYAITKIRERVRIF